MGRGTSSTKAIWLVCLGIGLLFLVRGAFQPYIFPLFENLAGFSYVEIALLLNCYVLAQSLCAPIAGWYADRTSIRMALTTSIVFGLCGFLLVSTRPGFVLSAAAVLAIGLSFVLGKIALNTILVLHSSADVLRRSVAKRATLLNLGSFLGNTLALQMTTRVGYSPHAVLLALLHLPLAIGLAAPAAPAASDPPTTRERGHFKSLLRNRGFLADALRRFAVVLPYGCWGTIIPKYAIDEYHSNDPVWVLYLTSLCTTVLGAQFLAVYLSDKVYAWGFKWEWWSMVSVALYCIGLLLFAFVQHPVMLPIAVVVFICGEVVMTPCFDETAKKHGKGAGMGTCLGLLHSVDGLGRLLGAAFALAVYGWMQNASYRELYWPLVAGAFFCASCAVHGAARIIARGSKRVDNSDGGVNPDTAATIALDVSDLQNRQSP